METVKYEMDVPKDGKEVVDLLDGIIEKVMAKAPVTEYVGLLDEFVAAAEGAQNIPEEARSQYRDELVGYMTHKIMSRLLPVKLAPEAAPAV